MDEFEDEDDVELNRPLDKRFVALGLLMLVSGLFGAVFFEDRSIRWVCVACLLASFFVMTKKEGVFD